MTKTALLTHEDCARHVISAGHPEQPARMKAVLDALEAEGLIHSMEQIEATEAQREHLLLAHPAAYVDAIFEASPSSGSVQLDADTAMNEYSLRAARLGAGAGIQSVDLLMKGEIKRTFCCVRPCLLYTSPSPRDS